MYDNEDIISILAKGKKINSKDIENNQNKKHKDDFFSNIQQDKDEYLKEKKDEERGLLSNLFNLGKDKEDYKENTSNYNKEKSEVDMDNLSLEEQIYYYKKKEKTLNNSLLLSIQELKDQYSNKKDNELIMIDKLKISFPDIVFDIVINDNNIDVFHSEKDKAFNVGFINNIFKIVSEKFPEYHDNINVVFNENLFEKDKVVQSIKNKIGDIEKNIIKNEKIINELNNKLEEQIRQEKIQEAIKDFIPLKDFIEQYDITQEEVNYAISYLNAESMIVEDNINLIIKDLVLKTIFNKRNEEKEKEKEIERQKIEEEKRRLEREKLKHDLLQEIKKDMIMKEKNTKNKDIDTKIEQKINKKNEDRNKLGQYLNNLRSDNNEKLKEMAKKLNISSEYLSDIEFNRVTPPLNLGKDLAKIYQLDKKEEDKVTTIIDDIIINFNKKDSSNIKNQNNILKNKKVNIQNDKEKDIDDILNTPNKDNFIDRYINKFKSLNNNYKMMALSFIFFIIISTFLILKPNYKNDLLTGYNKTYVKPNTLEEDTLVVFEGDGDMENINDLTLLVNRRKNKDLNEYYKNMQLESTDYNFTWERFNRHNLLIMKSAFDPQYITVDNIDDFGFDKLNIKNPTSDELFKLIDSDINNKNIQKSINKLGDKGQKIFVYDISLNKNQAEKLYNNIFKNFLAQNQSFIKEESEIEKKLEHENITISEIEEFANIVYSNSNIKDAKILITTQKDNKLYDYTITFNIDMDDKGVFAMKINNSVKSIDDPNLEIEKQIFTMNSINFNQLTPRLKKQEFQEAVSDQDVEENIGTLKDLEDLDSNIILDEKTKKVINNKEIQEEKIIPQDIIREKQKQKEWEEKQKEKHTGIKTINE